jgi:hypothetical protein
MLQGILDGSMIFVKNNSENVTVNAGEVRRHKLPNNIPPCHPELPFLFVTLSARGDKSAVKPNTPVSKPELTPCRQRRFPYGSLSNRRGRFRHWK